MEVGMSTGKECGFTYLTVMMFLFFVTSVSIFTAEEWETSSRREAERELLFVGHEIRCAIGSYYERGPGTEKRYPSGLGDLLDDKRFLFPVRHLRKIYNVSIGQPGEWQYIYAPEGGIMGVFLQSSDVPLKQSGFDDEFSSFAGKLRYSDWRFVYRPDDTEVTAACFDSNAGVN